jgi:hypothetical protein
VDAVDKSEVLPVMGMIFGNAVRSVRQTIRKPPVSDFVNVGNRSLTVIVAVPDETQEARIGLIMLSTHPVARDWTMAVVCCMYQQPRKRMNSTTISYQCLSILGGCSNLLGKAVSQASINSRTKERATQQYRTNF